MREQTKSILRPAKLVVAARPGGRYRMFSTRLFLLGATPIVIAVGAATAARLQRPMSSNLLASLSSPPKSSVTPASSPPPNHQNDISIQVQGKTLPIGPASTHYVMQKDGATTVVDVRRTATVSGRQATNSSSVSISVDTQTNQQGGDAGQTGQ